MPTNIVQIRSEGRQSPVVARADFDYTDFDGTNFLPCLELPADAVILRGRLCIITAFDASSTLSVGKSGAATSLLAATAADATACTALTEDFDGAAIGATTVYGLTSNDAALAAGVGALEIEYIQIGKAEFTQG